MIKDILRGKTDQEIADDLAKLHPIEQFTVKFFKYYLNDPRPSNIINIIHKCDPDSLIRWTIYKDVNEMYIIHRTYNTEPDPLYNIFLEYNTTFETFKRTIQVRYGQCQLWGEDERIIADNRFY